VEQGLFRADLFYRLSGVEIHVPPLRQRPEDIPELARYFLARHQQTRDLTITPRAEDALCVYGWPGNVRELERLMERAVALAESDRIELDDLPARVRGEYGEVLGPSITIGESMRAWGSRYARLVFERCGRNKRQTCRVLNISYHTLAAYLRYPDRSKADPSKQWPAWVKSASDPASDTREVGV
jgi:two-component system, NtrC family, response regulator HydG